MHNHIASESDTNEIGLAENARERAGLFAFFSNVFNLQPNTEFVNRLRLAKFNNLLKSSPEIPFQIKEQINEISRFWNDTSNLEEEELIRMLSVDWNQLFRGTGSSPITDKIMIPVDFKE
jgi:hypothetical protein